MSAVDLGGALDATPAAVADLVGDIDIPCEAIGHVTRGEQRARWWWRLTHRGCEMCEVRAVCNPCRVRKEIVLARAVMRRESYTHSCGAQHVAAADIEMTFTSLGCAP